MNYSIVILKQDFACHCQICLHQESDDEQFRSRTEAQTVYCELYILFPICFIIEIEEEDKHERILEHHQASDAPRVLAVLQEQHWSGV